MASIRPDPTPNPAALVDPSAAAVSPLSPAATALPPARGWIQGLPETLLFRALFVIAAFVALHSIVTWVGMGWPWKITGVLAAGAIARQLAPTQMYRVMAATGLAVLYLWKPKFFLFEVPFLLLLWTLRKHTAGFWAALVVGTLVLPKTLFKTFYTQPGYWDWVSPAAMGHIFLVGVLWYMEKRRGRTPDATFSQWLTLFAAPANPLNPLNFGPLDMWRPAQVNQLAVGRSLLLVAIKAAALWTINGQLTTLLIKEHSLQSLSAMSLAEVWLILGVSYLRLALYLSGTADVVILILRVFGWQLDHPFRWALLAWNPVELWRRWSIYNRKLLLKVFYFPLGGGTKRRYLNVMITFWASALVLHTGWFGSYYFSVGAAGWRDQTVYFTLQGVAVCACLYLWQRRGKDPSSDRGFRLSAGRVVGTVATQAYSAYVHIIVMAQHLDWGERWTLMARCLGF